LENEERASDDVVEPTVTAAATLAGEELHALAFELPAAIEYVMPSLIELTGRGYLDLLATPSPRPPAEPSPRLAGLKRRDDRYDNRSTTTQNR